MMKQAETSLSAAPAHWLRGYYLIRAGFSIIWVALVLTLGQQLPALGAALLVLYPAWDAAANYLDGTRNGGLRQNRSQAINVIVSALTTVLVLVALQFGPSAVLGVFGGWAIVSGLLQLTTAVRRWALAGAQWAMVLSGGQSALAGGAFLFQAQQAVPAVAPTIAGYAGFGAIYFLISAIALFVGRKGSKAGTATNER